MKNYIKNHGKILLFAVGILISHKAFSASEATKRLIQETLAKYGISAGGKEVCGTGREPEYNKQTGIVKCKNIFDGDSNNCWDASSRLCKECPYKTIVSQRDHITCRQIICPEGFELVKVVNGNCPADFELKSVAVNSCSSNDFDAYTEIQATNNYSTQSTNCNKIN